MKKNGKTSKGTTRWRCKNCNSSTTKRRPDITAAADFKLFIDHITGPLSLNRYAQLRNTSRWTLNRKFTNFWFITPLSPVDPSRIVRLLRT